MGTRTKTMRPALGAVVATLWVAAIIVCVGQAGPATSPGAPATTGSSPPHPSMSGRWELNARACEPAQARGADDAPPPRGRGRSILSESSQEEMRRVSQPRPILLIARREADYTITDDEGRVTRLRPDGGKVRDAAAWPPVERTTRWEGSALVTETRLSTGARVIQTYKTEEEGFRLVILTRVEGGHSLNTLTFKWVYDQMPD